MSLFMRLLVICFLTAFAAVAQQRFIVRTTLGEIILRTSCSLLGCEVVAGLEDPAGQVFLIRIPNTLNAGTILASLTQSAGITNSEVDQTARIADANWVIPDVLYREDRVSYFGSTVRHGYLSQPAVSIVRLT